MTNFRKSVARPAPGAGAPKGKNANISVVYVDDILAFPGTDANGVLLVGNIVLKAGAKMEKIYETDESQKASHKFEGDADAGGFLKMFEGTHPGDELEINEFVQNNIEVPVILIYDLDCNTNKRKIVGLPCNPLYLKAEFEDSKDGVKHTLNYEQRRRDRHVSKFYEGTLSFAVPFVAPSTALNLAAVNGDIIHLPVSDVVDTDITVTANDYPAGKVISLVGNGGDEPATLAAGVSGPVTVLLKNGTEWVALKDAVINLLVYDAGAVTYLQEISRS